MHSLTVEGLGLDGNLVESNNFPLPKLQQKLRRLAGDLYNGKGFFLIRGIEQTYCVEDSMIVFLGIQSYIAERRMRQDEAGNMIGQVFKILSSQLSANTILSSCPFRYKQQQTFKSRAAFNPRYCMTLERHLPEDANKKPAISHRSRSRYTCLSNS